SGGDGLTFELEVGVVGAAGIHAEGEAAGKAIDAADLPAANRRVGEAIPAGAPLAAVAEGQVVDPVRIDLMPSVEVRRTAKLLGIPSVDDGAEAAERTDALGVRSYIERFRQRVVEVKLESMRR